MSFRSVPAVSAAVLVAGCSSSNDLPSASSAREQPIIGGVQDTSSEDNAVVMVYWANGRMCTGTVISPRVVMTAWHCVAQANESVTCSDSDIGADYNPSDLYILKGPDPFSVGKASARGQKVFHPVKSGNGLCGQDIALIALSTPLTGVTPLPIRVHDVYAQGDTFRAIGYGLTDPNDKTSAGVRYYRDDVQLTTLYSAEFVGTRSICSGDSGGPAISQSGAVIGVTSRGADCNGDNNWWTRVDKFQSLIDQAVGYTGGTYTDEDGAVHQGTSPDAGVADAQPPPDANPGPDSNPGPDADTGPDATPAPEPGPDAAEQAEAAPPDEQLVVEGDAGQARLQEQPQASRNGGCSLSSTGSASDAGWWLLLPAAGLLLRRRRRALHRLGHPGGMRQ